MLIHQKIVVLFAFSVFSLCGFNVHAQNLRWTGAVDAAFFNEANWVEVETGQVPAAGTIDPGVPINKNLIIENSSKNCWWNFGCYIGYHHWDR